MSLFDRIPADDAPAQDWFLYFRITKYLPAMKTKFNNAAEKSQSPEHTAKLRLAFSAAGLDICLPFTEGEPRDVKLDLLEDYAGVPAETLIGVNAQDLAPLLRKTLPTVLQDISTLGFEMDENCKITRLDRGTALQP